MVAPELAWVEENGFCGKQIRRRRTSQNRGSAPIDAVRRSRLRQCFSQYLQLTKTTFRAVDDLLIQLWWTGGQGEEGEEREEREERKEVQGCGV